jgi:uncharacterized protein (TIGR02611 family)
VIAIAGGIVLVAGIIAIPYPGPGWLIVFAGLGILSTEFEWASRLLGFARGKYEQWQEWLKTQNVAVKTGFVIMTGIIVILTIYLLNGYGIINSLLGLNQDWLNSPLPFFN